MKNKLIANCNLNENAAKTIASLVNAGILLEVLILGDNPITSVGVNAILDAAATKNCLLTLDLRIFWIFIGSCTPF